LIKEGIIYTDAVESINEVAIVFEKGNWIIFEWDIFWFGFGDVVLIILEHFNE
jgi:hypothetical protein